MFAVCHSNLKWRPNLYKNIQKGFSVLLLDNLFSKEAFAKQLICKRKNLTL